MHKSVIEGYIWLNDAQHILFMVTVYAFIFMWHLFVQYKIICKVYTCIPQHTAHACTLTYGH